MANTATHAYRSLNYDAAVKAGLEAFAAWDDECYPHLCPCCGSWLRADGTPGPELPNCANWRGDQCMNPWPHDKSCARIRDTDYADLCSACSLLEARLD